MSKIYRHVFSYVPGVDYEFMHTRLSFKECYIDHDPLADESIARFRRYKLFTEVTQLVEETRIPSFRHCEIHEYMRPLCAHTSCWWLGEIPFFMTEPYGEHDFNVRGYKHFVIPQNIAIYGGGPFTLVKGAKAPTVGVLYVKLVHTRYLENVSLKLLTAAKNAMPWNSVTDEERKVAKARVRSELKSINLGGRHD